MTAYAYFSTFSTKSAQDKYDLNVSGYSGTTGDSLMVNNGSKFSTYDQDNDYWSGKCALDRSGAYLYLLCVILHIKDKDKKSYNNYTERKSLEV